MVIRTAAGADRTDTTATAVLIMNALLGNDGNGPEVGEAFECLYSNQSTSTYIITIAGGTGVTPVGNVLTIAPDITKRLVFVCTAKGTNTYSTTTSLWTNSGATFDCYLL